MASQILTKKSLYTNRIDVGGADRHFTERYQLPDVPAHCSDARRYTYDIYGRLASPYSLNQLDKTCTNLNDHHNVQAFLERENTERPFISFSYPNPRHQYDTMGVGRDMAGGRWHSVNMPNQPVYRSHPPPPYISSDSAVGGRSLAQIYKTNYQG